MVKIIKHLLINLSTPNCWYCVCLMVIFFLNESNAQQVPDSLNSAKSDSILVTTDSLTNDSNSLSNELKSKVKYAAKDSIRYDLEAEKVYLFGKASIIYEDINLAADFIELNFNDKRLIANGIIDSTGAIVGKPIFKQADDEFKADTIRYNFETKRGKISEITTKDGDSYIHGSTVKKEANNTTYIRNGYYTTCELDHPHYYIASNKIKVIPNNKVVTGPADLFVGDVPTPLAIPFGFFPNKKGRTSGILFPAYGESDQLGFFLTNGGYYFGLSDFFDLALTGDIYTRGSYRLNANSNYALKYRFNGNVSINYSKIKNSQRELPDYSLEEGFFVKWTHTQDPKARPNSNFSANVNAGSSSFYRNNLTSANNFLTNTFTSSINYSRSFPGKPYSFSAGLAHSQNTTTRDVNISFPSANFAITRQTPFKRKAQVGAIKWYEKIGISYNTNLLSTITTKDSLLLKTESLDKIRYGIQHTIPINTSFSMLKYFTVSPSFNYIEKWYLSSVNKSFDAETNTVTKDTIAGFKAARDFGFAINMNTRIFGMLQFKRGKISAIRHIITPNIGFSWRPDFSGSTWGAYKNVQIDSTGREQRYSIFEDGIFGGPSFGKSSLLNFSLDNNLEMKVKQITDTSVTDKKVKILESIAAGLSYNFAADSLQLSNVAISARTTVLDKINLNVASSYDPYALNDLGQRIDRFLLEDNGKIARLNNANFSISFTIFKRREDYNSDKGTDQELKEINTNKDAFIDYSVPFNLNIGYNWFFQNNFNTPDQITQTLNFGGDIQVTDNWKVTYNSGYDFQQKDISYTSLGIYRDLHCWEMRLNWVPFGFQQNYFFQINVKSSVLQDLKLTRKTDRFDNR